MRLWWLLWLVGSFSTDAVVTQARATADPLGYDPNQYIIFNSGFKPRYSGEGAFRLYCRAGHLNYDDPIVYPGRTGVAHLHQFFGNTSVNAFTSPENIRQTGDSTCDGGPLNRSGYWIPALIDPVAGAVIKPKDIVVYYKGEAKDGVIRLPPGLRMVAGFDPGGGKGVRTYWRCLSAGGEATTSEQPTIPDGCSGGQLQAVVAFPHCWDGRNLDSPDHRSHMAYGTGGGGWGSCPNTHPVTIPRITYNLFYTIPPDSTTNDWHLSSDRHQGLSLADGESLHADWMNGWNWVNPQKTRLASDIWFEECLARTLDCNTSNLGEGLSLRPPPASVGSLVVPIPLPPR